MVREDIGKEVYCKGRFLERKVLIKEGSWKGVDMERMFLESKSVGKEIGRVLEINFMGKEDTWNGMFLERKFLEEKDS